MQAPLRVEHKKLAACFSQTFHRNLYHRRRRAGSKVFAIERSQTHWPPCDAAVIRGVVVYIAGIDRGRQADSDIHRSGLHSAGGAVLSLTVTVAVQVAVAIVDCQLSRC